MKFLILNGPNLNLQGQRECSLYGTTTFDELLKELRARYPEHTIDYFQSNIEGEMIDCLHSAKGCCDGVVLNAGGYTHSSVALRDAVAAVGIPTIEVHISNIAAREEFRHTSLLTPVCRGAILGLGMDGYRLALEALLKK